MANNKSNIFSDKIKIDFDEPAVDVDFLAFKKVVQSRRSVRQYETEEIPDILVRECLELALLAPNSSNLQPWEFYWVKNDAIKKNLARLCFGQPAATSAPVLIVCVARTKKWKRNCQQMLEVLSQNPKSPIAVLEYYKKLAPFIYNQGPFGIYAPFKKLLFTLMGFFRVVPRGPFGVSGMREWAHKSTALACENLMLSFRAAGYDSCPMEGFDEWKVKKLLNLPSDAFVTMVVSAGKRKPGGIYGPQLRFPSEQFIKIVD